jgi:hypothetical protein
VPQNRGFGIQDLSILHQDFLKIAIELLVDQTMLEHGAMKALSDILV